MTNEQKLLDTNHLASFAGLSAASPSLPEQTTNACRAFFEKW